MRHFVFLAALAATPFTVPTPASALDVMRCNERTASGIYVPFLRVVTQRNTLDIRIGEHGLTRAAYYDDQGTKQFLLSKTNLVKRQLTGEISDTCGADQRIEELASARPEPTVVTQEPPEPETEYQEPDETTIGGDIFVN